MAGVVQTTFRYKYVILRHSQTADYLTVIYTTTSASDVFRPTCRMECARELDTPLCELLVLCI